MIDSQADLKKLLQLCRKQGVTELEWGGVKFKLGELPVDENKTVPDASDSESDNPYANFPDTVLTQEQLMFYSSGGHPDDDPEVQQ